MATVQIRYIVRDLDSAVAFYTSQLGFAIQMHRPPSFAMLTRGDLRLVLSVPNPQAGGGQPMPDGRQQEPGGWNRFAIEVDDLPAMVERLRAAGARFRNEMVIGVGGNQILVEDPSGNPIELFQPTIAAAQLATRRIVNSRCVLAVRDLKLSTEYYVDVLGFIRDPIDADGWSFLSRDNFRVMLGECRDERPASELGDHSYFAYWNIDGVDAFYREVAARGALVGPAPADKPWGLREFTLRTPDGHRITCGEEIKLRN